MADNQMRRFEFVSKALPPDTFGVVRWRGSEGLSQCYRFEIELVSREANLDLRTVLQSPATFTLLRDEGDIPFHGILAQFHHLHQVDESTFYRAVLVPKLWWLGLTHHNQVFLNKTVPQMLEACLKDGGLGGGDFETRLKRDYPPWEFVCQYRESHLEFVSRWLEREGIYYYFAQAQSGERVVLTDSRIAHGPMSEGAELRYQPPSGLEYSHREEVILKLDCHQRLLPRAVILKDYNDQTPSLDLAGQAPVSPRGRGDVYYYGEHIRNQREGSSLAAVRAEELLCREREFHGESTIPYLRPGYTFQLKNHYRDDCEIACLTVSLEHEGSQAAYLLAGMGFELSAAEREPYYRNRFVAIPAELQFRPERKTEKVRFFGTLNAKIDASGSGQYAELDEQGRYKVILPFDLSGRAGGKASAWVRMMQPYAGGDHGMHFPLHKGTEVLLTFIDGDPDRPVIAGAVPNPVTPSLVRDTNQTMAVLQTSGQNKIAMEDRAGTERILLHVPRQASFIRIGAPNDPPAAIPPTTTAAPTTQPPTTAPPTTAPPTTAPPTTAPPTTGGETTKGEGEKGIHVETEGDLEFKCKNCRETITGNSFTFVIGAEESFYLGNYSHIKFLTADDITIGLSFDFKIAWAWELSVEGEGKFAPQKREFVLDTTHMHLKKTDLEGEITHLVGSQKRLAGEVSHLAGQTSVLAGTTSRLAGEVSDMSTSVNQLALTTEAMIATANEVYGENTQIFAEAVETVIAQTDLVTEHTRVIGAATNSVAEKTDLHAENTVLSGLTTLI